MIDKNKSLCDFQVRKGRYIREEKNWFKWHATEATLTRRNGQGTADQRGREACHHKYVHVSLAWL